ncbi:single-stranded DNA-binding protein [Corynebacterium suedekumii]|nr:single-stranded DNA-binding protein [Corynebacterium suedekumii]
MAQGDTNITVVGNAVNDPELRFTPSGAAVANFRIASTPRKFNSQTNQWEDGEALFLTCNVWRQAAENVAETISKGMRIIVTGRLRQRSSQTKEGENRTVYEIEVDEVGPSSSTRPPRSTAILVRVAATSAAARARIRVSLQSQPQGGFGGGQGNQGGFGGNQNQPQRNQGNQMPNNDPWGSAPPAGGFGGAADDEPPF